MKKSYLFITALLMLSACGNNQQQQEQTDTTNTTKVESTASETQPSTPDYHFDYQLVKGDDGDYQSIIVKGYEDQKCTFQCSHDLVASVSEESAADTQWIIDTEDINFDGQPDLQIFLWHTAVGQVIRTDITASERCAFYRIHYPWKGSLLIDATHYLGKNPIPDQREQQQFVGGEVEAVSDHEVRGYS